MAFTHRIYTDGSMKNKNPGQGGFALRIYSYPDGKTRYLDHSAGFHATTISRMELMALAVALEMCPPDSTIEVKVDSKYVSDNVPMVHRWERCGWRGTSGMIKNVDLWERVLKQIARHKKVVVKWIPTKSCVGNKVVDSMAKSAAHNPTGYDEGYMPRSISDGENEQGQGSSG